MKKNNYQDQAKKQMRYKLATKNLKWFSLIGCIFGIVALLTFFLNWSDIYNTKIVGVEIGASGANYLAAGFSGDYTNPAYGGISVPFYYYAKSYTEILGVITVVAFLLLVLALVGSLVAQFTKKELLFILPAVAFLVSGVLLAAGFGVALAMNGSKILPIYCSGNPACSIRSFAIIPAILCLGGGVLHIVACVKYFLAKLEMQ